MIPEPAIYQLGEHRIDRGSLDEQANVRLREGEQPLASLPADSSITGRNLHIVFIRALLTLTTKRLIVVYATLPAKAVNNSAGRNYQGTSFDASKLSRRERKVHDENFKRYRFANMIELAGVARISLLRPNELRIQGDAESDAEQYSVPLDTDVIRQFAATMADASAAVCGGTVTSRVDTFQSLNKRRAPSVHDVWEIVRPDGTPSTLLGPGAEPSAT